MAKAWKSSVHINIDTGYNDEIQLLLPLYYLLHLCD